MGILKNNETLLRRSVLIALLYLIPSLQAMLPIDDPDIWWHLRNAEYLFTEHKLPRADMYSFTVIGHAWINHEWGAEIPYYLGWRLGGLAGIKLVSIALLEVIFLGLAYLCWKQSGLPVRASLGMDRRKKVWWNKSL